MNSQGFQAAEIPESSWKRSFQRIVVHPYFFHGSKHTHLCWDYPSKTVIGEIQNCAFGMVGNN